MTTGAIEESSDSTKARGPHRLLGEHCVILKSKSCPTKATRIWKEHVRHVFGKKKYLSDEEIQSLKNLQDQYFRCNNQGSETSPSVSFWVESPCDKEECYYLGDIPYVPASLESVREEVRNNGVSNQLRKKRKKKNPPVDSTEIKVPPALASCHPKLQPPPLASSQPKFEPSIHPEPKTSSSINKQFALTYLERWREQVTLICRKWINESNWVEQFAKKHLVNKLQQDLDRHAAIFEHHMRQDCLDEYDRRRNSVHASIFLDSINTLGNAMVDWYDQDLKKRAPVAPPSLSSDQPCEKGGQSSVAITQDTRQHQASGVSKVTHVEVQHKAEDKPVQLPAKPKKSETSDRNFSWSLDEPGNESVWTEATSVTSVMEEDSMFGPLEAFPPSSNVPGILNPSESRDTLWRLDTEDDAVSEMSLDGGSNHSASPLGPFFRQGGKREESKLEEPTEAYGDTRLYWQKQSLKEENAPGSLHWQKIAFPKLKTIEEA